jgi:hypothetical protein
MRKLIAVAILVGAFASPAVAQVSDGACDPAIQPSCPGAVPPTTIPDVCQPIQPSCLGSVPPAAEPDVGSDQPSDPQNAQSAIDAPSRPVSATYDWIPDAPTVWRVLFFPSYMPV